jgi:hypothetical protein
MLCPYCRTQYTLEQPCFCQPSLATQEARPDNAPAAQRICEPPAVSCDRAKTGALIES